MTRKHTAGFTLTELLAVIGVLAVIMVFTIPKLLNNQQKNTYKVQAKETGLAVLQAVAKYRLNRPLTPNTKMKDILDNYLNYVSIDTVSIVDVIHSTVGTSLCSSASNICYRMENGSTIKFSPDKCFRGTSEIDAVFVNVDPDGKVTTDGSATSPGKGMYFWIYADGDIRTWDNLKTGTIQSNGDCTASQGPMASNPATVPPWFSWD